MGLNHNREKALLLLIRAITPLHVGVGEGEHVDLSVQRDEFGFPIIWGTSLKGAIKSQFNRIYGKDEKLIKELFGDDENPSKLRVLDARLFLIPARTYKEVWTYVTSKQVIERLEPYAELAGFKLDTGVESKGSSTVGNAGAHEPIEKVDVIVNKDYLLEDGKITLNEIFDLTAKSNPTEFNMINTLINKISSIKNEKIEKLIKRIEERGICLVTDEESKSRAIINKSIVIQYRIRLKGDEKVVKEGGLWSEELLPSETLMLSALVVNESDLSKLKNLVEKNPFYLFIGGKESVGRGLAEIYLLDI
ncbi:MAG: type III-B CRISPR module RAMP protein Cmr4 [Fervidicoccaceae archaeon]